MASSIEDILGKIAREWPIPGTSPGEADEVRYVSFDRSQKPSDLFEKVVWKVNPPLVKDSGVVLDTFIVTLPDERRFIL